MTALNVFAALSQTGEFDCGSICVDCLMWVANADDSGSGDDWDQGTVLKVLNSYEFLLGHFHTGNEFDTRCSHLGTECEEDCSCARTDFATSLCSLCNSDLAGSREDVIIHSRDLLDTKMTQEQFVKLSEMCSRYSVPMRVGDYLLNAWGGNLVEGWVGGPDGSGLDGKRKTIYVGVEPNGNSHT